MNNNTAFAVIAIVPALALFGVVAAVTVASITLQQEAEARGCRTSQAVNASQGRCFRG